MSRSVEDMELREDPMKSADLQAFLTILGAPNKLFLDIFNAYAYTSDLEKRVRDILSGFVGTVRLPTISYELVTKPELEVAGKYIEQNYLDSLLMTYKEAEQARKDLKKRKILGEQGTLYLKEIHWSEVGGSSASIELTLNPQQIKISYLQAKDGHEPEILGKLRKEASIRGVGYYEEARTHRVRG
ncbi:MAG: hypothetical protein NTX24_03340 [Candidatus Pacearchaeota archaeon]|nr:hypothetical protein [Candidatus Pacearchaeota archaeon]